MPITNEMESPGASGRRRVSTRTNAEDQALDQIAKEVSVIKIFLRRHPHFKLSRSSL